MNVCKAIQFKQDLFFLNLSVRGQNNYIKCGLGYREISTLTHYWSKYVTSSQSNIAVSFNPELLLNSPLPLLDTERMCFPRLFLIVENLETTLKLISRGMNNYDIAT